MEMHLKISGGGEPLKKKRGQMAVRTLKKSQFFLHAKHRATNTKLGLRSLKAKNLIKIV